jgi:hypothetical protein
MRLPISSHIRKLESAESTDALFEPTEGFVVIVEGQKIVVPYRIKFNNGYAPTDTAQHYCRRSRSSNGYKREAALKKLLTFKLTPQEAAYLLVALGDYVIEISTIPLDASAETKDA